MVIIIDKAKSIPKNNNLGGGSGHKSTAASPSEKLEHPPPNNDKLKPNLPLVGDDGKEGIVKQEEYNSSCETPFEDQKAEATSNNSGGSYHHSILSRLKTYHSYERVVAGHGGVQDEEYIKFLHSRGLELVPIVGDGNCLFRALSDQLFGEQSMQDHLRERCLNYMEQEKAFFSEYIDGDFGQYIRHKRRPGVFGDHLELQALIEIYNRSVEIYIPGREVLSLGEPQLLTSQDKKPPPLRLSYHNGNHYNSIRDLNNPQVGMGFGLADEMQLDDAIHESELTMTDQELLKKVQGDSEKYLTEQILTDSIIQQSVEEQIQAEVDEALMQTSIDEYLSQAQKLPI